MAGMCKRGQRRGANTSPGWPVARNNKGKELAKVETENWGTPGLVFGRGRLSSACRSPCSSCGDSGLPKVEVYVESNLYALFPYF